MTEEAESDYEKTEELGMVVPFRVYAEADE